MNLEARFARLEKMVLESRTASKVRALELEVERAKAETRELAKKLRGLDGYRQHKLPLKSMNKWFKTFTESKDKFAKLGSLVKRLENGKRIVYLDDRENLVLRYMLRRMGR